MRDTGDINSVGGILGRNGLDVEALQPEFRAATADRLGFIASRLSMPTCITGLASYLASIAALVLWRARIVWLTLRAWRLEAPRRPKLGLYSQLMWLIGRNLKVRTLWK